MITEEKLLKLRKLADAMYYAAQQLTTDASRLHKAMDEYHKFIIHEYKEESISEDLGEAIEQSFIYHENRGDDFRCDEQIETSYRYGFETGANWMKEQILDCNTTLQRTFELGKQEMKHQMMKKAVSGHVGQTINGMLRALSDETFGDMGFTAGDKVKLIIIKED